MFGIDSCYYSIKIYNENDELIMEKENFCSYVQTDTKANKTNLDADICYSVEVVQIQE